MRSLHDPPGSGTLDVPEISSDERRALSHGGGQIPIQSNYGVGDG
jgi:hypothetical protein